MTPNSMLFLGFSICNFLQLMDLLDFFFNGESKQVIVYNTKAAWPVGKA